MEESHYSNNYFWTPIPTMAGQFENVMFINKIKEQLMAEKSCGQTASPQNQQTEQQQQQQQQLQQVQSYSHALITSGTISGVTQTPSIDVKECGQTQPMVTENVTVLPLPSTALMTGLVITSPSASLSSSSSGLSPLIHPPTFSLAGTPTMIVSGLPPGLSGQTVPSLSGLEKKVPEEAQGPGHPPHPAQDEGPNKPPGTRKRKVRPSEPTLAELADPYAVPNDDDGGAGFAHSPSCRSQKCRFTPSHTQSPNPIIVRTAQRHLPTPHTWPSTSASIPERNPTTAAIVRRAFDSSHTSSSTHGFTQEIGLTSVCSQAVTSPSRNSQTFSHTGGNTIRTNHLSVNTVTARTRTPLRYRCTSQHTPSNISRHMLAIPAGNPTHRRPT
ncbi:uncharacterized protein [Scyliorhinus torazame]|uniref:uncharacterized protein isoform X3 n=1 Tax=Scyliorhinus torazame TaxID=75743 RepID=UPI003B5C4B1C